MQDIKNNIGYIIVAVVAVIVIIVAWMKAEPAAAPTDTNINPTSTLGLERETELPDFAYIEERDGERVLVNERDGYELVLEDDWVPEYYTNVVEVFAKDDYPSGELTASFFVTDNDSRDLSLDVSKERWINFSNEDCLDCYIEEKRLNISGIEVIKMQDKAGLGERYNYLFIKEEKFIDITVANFSEEAVVSLIESFKIL